jgi:asparagine synthase (glutamine-hydrolysing)
MGKETTTMCGIAGWVDFGRGLLAERPALEAMTATMTCRGPDAGGVWHSACAAIGHCRLSVIDIEGGAQPMRASHHVPLLHRMPVICADPVP